MVILRASGEAVVGGERMRGDAQVADARVVGKRDVEGRRRPSRAGALVEYVRDGVGGQGAARDDVGEGDIELGGAVVIEQAAETGGGRSDDVASARERVEEGVGLLARAAQPVAAAQVAGAPLRPQTRTCRATTAPVASAKRTSDSDAESVSARLTSSRGIE